MPPSNGARLSHSTASSMDLTCQSQKPAMSSLVSAKGPSVTVRCCPENLTRLPFELACKPFASSRTPALTNSSLNFPMEVRISVLGMTPASESLLALTNTITRIVILLLTWIWNQGTGRDGRPTPHFTYTSNEQQLNRQVRPIG